MFRALIKGALNNISQMEMPVKSSNSVLDRCAAHAWQRLPPMLCRSLKISKWALSENEQALQSLIILQLLHVLQSWSKFTTSQFPRREGSVKVLAFAIRPSVSACCTKGDSSATDFLAAAVISRPALCAWDPLSKPTCSGAWHSPH